MGINIDLEELKINLEHYLYDLRNFHFSFSNPLFWGFLIVVFSILSRFWGAKKSFSFCLIIAVVLLATTKLQGFTINMTAAPIYAFIPLLIRIFSLFAIAIIVLYYTVIK